MSDDRALAELLDAESRLDRSFGFGVVALFAYLGWPLAARALGVLPRPWAGLLQFALLLALFAAYVGLGLSLGRAAALLGKPRAPYVGWVIAAPILSAFPIPVVSLLIAASPLSLKLLLSRQLREAIHERTFAG